MSFKVLIISPYFPPANTADMQRIRMSLPYFKQFGWDAEVVVVDPEYVDLPKDDLLMQSIPADIKIHKVKALNKSWTSKLGIGSISYRSYWFIRKKVNQLLKETKFDLIYFSTTQFQVCILGAYWKRRFKIPYVIDMHDPWHSEYYQDKPKEQQPPKYGLAYRLNKYLEPIAIKMVDGLISVSENYIETLKTRYPQIKQIPAATITFGAFEPDLKIAADNEHLFGSLLDPGFKNIVYVGRGGIDMHNAIEPVFETLKNVLLNDRQIFSNIRLWFIGTSYAPNGTGKPTILPLAKKFGIEDSVIEITGRIGYYQVLAVLQKADALFIPGSDDPGYTASKIYPYLLTGKPLLTIFNSGSPALNILQEYNVKSAYSYDKTSDLHGKIESFFKEIIEGKAIIQNYSQATIGKYSAKMMTKRQCDLFNAVILKGQ